MRYLDNGSKAVARLSHQLGQKLVFTLTPDPHKSMVDTCGVLRSFPFMQLAERLNKIRIGDELIRLSHALVGIGDEGLREELASFFPQIKQPALKKKTWMISEGVYTDQPLCGQEACSYEEEMASLSFLPPGFLDKPIILNVGRLSVAKGQMALLEAFHRDHPQLRGRFYHQEAVSNDQIRLLEKAVMNHEHTLPHIYLASSLKEEFGIAILEAMSQGFLVIGPQKGGVKFYLKDGVNGFLIDTRSAETMVQDLEVRLGPLAQAEENKSGPAQLARMQALGKETVDSRFSIEEISQDFLSLYLSL